MKMIVKFCLFLSFVLASNGFADPPRPNHDHWRNTKYAGHYVRYDYASKTYVETINCQVYYRFKLVSNELNTLTIYDASRNMTVRLDYNGMYLKASGAANFTFYQAGTFDTRTQFKHEDANGTYTGTISKLDACNWVEWFPGQNNPSYYFKENSTTADFINLYDKSRDMWVGLNNKAMYLKTGNNAYAFFKNGKW